MHKIAALTALLLLLSACGAANGVSNSPTALATESIVETEIQEPVSSEEAVSPSNASSFIESSSASSAVAEDAKNSLDETSNADGTPLQKGVSEAASAAGDAASSAAADGLDASVSEESADMGTGDSEADSSAPAALDPSAEKTAAPAPLSAEPAPAAQSGAKQASSSEPSASAQKSADKPAAQKTAGETDAAEPAGDTSSKKTTAAKAASPRTAAPATAKSPSVKGSQFLGSLEKSVFKLQNEERVRNGLEPLVWDEELQSAARIRSRELYENSVFAHTRPDGRGWETVLEEEIPYAYTLAGENLCMTKNDHPNSNTATSAEFWVTQWINSPTHHANMLRPEYTRAGVGIYYIKYKDRDLVYAYATTIFADPVA